MRTVRLRGRGLGGAGATAGAVTAEAAVGSATSGSLSSRSSSSSTSSWMGVSSTVVRSSAQCASAPVGLGSVMRHRIVQNSCPGSEVQEHVAVDVDQGVRLEVDAQADEGLQVD